MLLLMLAGWLMRISSQEQQPAAISSSQQPAAAATAACMRACVAAFVIDTIYQLTRWHRPGRGESNFRIEIFEKNGHGRKGELGRQPPELALLSVPILLEYFHTTIRFSTPALSALLGPAGKIYILGARAGISAYPRTGYAQ